jgi:hypothetical protein
VVPVLLYGGVVGIAYALGLADKVFPSDMAPRVRVLMQVGVFALFVAALLSALRAATIVISERCLIVSYWPPFLRGKTTILTSAIDSFEVRLVDLGRTETERSDVLTRRIVVRTRDGKAVEIPVDDDRAGLIVDALNEFLSSVRAPSAKAGARQPFRT